MATDFTDAELKNLLNEGLSQNEIARRTGIPRSTLQRRFQEICVPKGHKGVHLGKHVSTPDVYNGTPPPAILTEAWDELIEMLEWWRRRKHALQTPEDTEEETERKTYHVRKRYIEAIQRAADLERVSITEIVNRAFGQYFSETQTKGTP